ncbi:hypothetical protein SB49_14055 [Sediminicola sp. YIK13]|uniref:DUF6443 domain-containing protein n=1 Tax=Sediminicola sp. YIK13 TaxID=1453352 RepID=UPI000722F15C|nr:DUF6443 domain-containing protein [Sediminicola sp. YIK13]ALM08802.1 hypothetical protein SB49_14055 [Sediminicola sp. YIK13]
MMRLKYTFLFLLATSFSFAQIIKPDAGQSTYIVTGTEALSSGKSIVLKPGSWIKRGANFTAKVTEITTANDAYTSFTLSSNENYVLNRSFQSPMGNFNPSITKEGDVIESVTYFDGLGRPKQSVGIKASPSKKDIITHMSYDEYGRMPKDYLPYEAAGALSTFRTDASSATNSYYQTFYSSDLNNSYLNPFSEKEFEPSPLNRVTKQAAPGYDWRLGGGHEIKLDYYANNANEVRFFKVTFSGGNSQSPILTGGSTYYPVGELYKNLVRDENQVGGTNTHVTEEYTDKNGRVVLKRIKHPYSGTTYDTYYVYDDFGNLTYVLTPKVTTDNVSANELNELCYQYKYDERNRLIEKKIPGKGWEYIVYNKLDQPILTKDPNLGEQGKWLFTKYDAFGRVAYTGLANIPGSTTRTSLQTAANGVAISWVTQSNTATNTGGTAIYYNNGGYPTSNISEIHTVNYYDTYLDTDGLNVPSSVLNQTKASNTKGLATVSKVRVLTTNQWITTITGYDSKGRAIYSASKNGYLGTTDIVETELDFGGKIKRSITNHVKGNNSSIVTEDNFLYDHHGRILLQKQKINGQAEVTLVENSYDKLGQLIQKKVGGNLQTVDFAYNIRGWLKQINNPSNLGTDLFGFKINYNSTELGGTSLYNGNISETIWKTKNDETSSQPWTQRAYSYKYDGLNRILGADYKIRSSSGSFGILGDNYFTLSNISYDKNGNIISLQRKGASGLIDNLAYSYHDSEISNRLKKVTDLSNNIEGFSDGTNATVEYTYDQNGNMVKDLNKSIGTTTTNGITYNHLNLPVKIVNSKLYGTINYIYDAMGNKLEKYVVGAGIAPTTTLYAGNYVYENNTLQFFSHAEGYVEPDGSGGYDYIYQYKDHLGNVRLSYEDANDNGSIATSEIREENNYYPFGLQHKGYNNVVNGTENNYQTYQGQELEEELGKNTLAFQWRDYDPAIARFNKIDRFAEKYVSHSPYAFTKNNPIAFREIKGDSISAGSQAEFNAQRTNVQNKQNDLTARRDRLVERGASQSRIDKLNTRIDGIGETLTNLGNLESSSQFYRLDSGAGEVGGTTYDPATGEVVIAYGSTANFVHESTHAGQFESGNIAFDSGTGNTYAQDLGDESASYRAQYAYDPSSVSGLSSTSRVRSLGDITNAWVQGIRTSTGANIYGVGGASNTGITPLNVNSTRADLIRAYPSNAGALGGLPADWTFRSLPTIYLKE